MELVINFIAYNENTQKYEIIDYKLMEIECQISVILDLILFT